MKISLALDNYCTHGCWYCCDNTTHKRKDDSYIDCVGVEEYLRLILRLADCTVNYRINGGEPFENPYIREITDGILKAGHNITFLTNLLHIDNVRDVCVKEQVQMEASFHLSRYSEAQIYQWSECFVRACKVSHSMDIIIVLTPEVVSNKKLPGHIEWIKKTGEYNDCKINIIYQELYTKDYPAAYTEDEKNIIRQWIDVDSFIKAARVLYLKGENCNYMTENLDVHRDGTISRCSSGYPGHRETLLKTTMRVKEGFTPCVYDKCLCPIRGIRGSLDLNKISFSEYCKKMNL